MHHIRRAVARSRPPLVIAETRHGFVCASAGVDASNAPEAGTLVLLPLDPDASAARIRERLHELTGHQAGVILSDSFGRPWRSWIVDVAIGVAGLRPLVDMRCQVDRVGYELRSTVIAEASSTVVSASRTRSTAAVSCSGVIGAAAAGAGEARATANTTSRSLQLKLT